MQTTVGHSPKSIFFDTHSGTRRAKCTLIEDIMKIKGCVPTTREFDDLYDLDIDLLHQEIIKAEDYAHKHRKANF